MDAIIGTWHWEWIMTGERKALYPCLSHMALDYVTIPGKYHLNTFMVIQITYAMVLQQHPLMLNTYSAMDDSFYHMFIAISLHC